MKETGERGSARHRLRRVLVTAEVALAVILVIGAGLLIRTVYNLTRVDAGFDRSRLVTFSMTLPRAIVLSGRTRAGVSAASGHTSRGAGRAGRDGHVGPAADTIHPGIQHGRRRRDGRRTAAGSIVDYYQFVMSDYFETMGIAIVAGRGFEPADATSLERVAIVNETLATRLWKGRDPIGQRLRPNLAASMGTATTPGTR